MVMGGQPTTVYHVQPGQNVASANAPPGGTYAQAPPAYAPTNQPVMATAVPITGGGVDPTTMAYEKNSGAPMAVATVTANPVVAQPQGNTMSVTLPANAHPGQILTVAAPNGLTVQVTVQSQHRPGETILVSY